jgi:hypothetical protein
VTRLKLGVRVTALFSRSQIRNPRLLKIYPAFRRTHGRIRTAAGEESESRYLVSYANKVSALLFFRAACPILSSPRRQSEEVLRLVINFYALYGRRHKRY